ncbi:MAG: NAD(P)/FAD-dependent oxidoreductase [Symploca sp. SIO2E6]|nr:NAD(P)/FAD-dependent oxidoreductase [Symploca sp. SIO2E6]
MQKLSKNTEKFDAIVIGSGPAGATSAYTLASQGYSVLLLEKVEFPRFHIGESMVPYIVEIFEKIGILDRLESEGFVRKLGVDISLSSGELGRANFADLAAGQKPYAFNLERCRFDKILLENAEEAGVRLLQRAEVKDLILDGDRIVGVEYKYQQQNYQAMSPFVIDASGRAGIVAKHFKLRKMNPKLRNVAIFQQFDNASEENNPAIEGDLIVGFHPDGWMWQIPLDDKTISVGAVVPQTTFKTGSPQEIFDAHLSRLPRLKARVQGATPVFEKLKTELDFCYHSERFAGLGYFLVGDAACFVDPQFSGGVYLGMLSGMKAAEAIADIFQGKDEQKAFIDYENFCKTGYDSYYRLIYAFYSCENYNVLKLFQSFPGGYKFMLQTMCGDLWGEPDQPVLSYLRSQEQWATFEEPFETVYGCPVYPNAGYKVADEAADSLC